MVLEHEIPQGCSLYFGQSARIKRDIEYKASQLLSENGFEEIVTPHFAFNNHVDMKEDRKLLRLSNEKNHLIVLRADSTIDTVRIISKRLGRHTSHEKWFYIQPVFTYPTNEVYQIGAEHINNTDLREFINLSTDIVANTGISPILQLSDMQIPYKVSQELGIDIELFKSGNIEAILRHDATWLHQLITVQRKEHLEEAIKLAPELVRNDLIRLKEMGEQAKTDNLVYAPLYYAPMEYYHGMFFHVFHANKTLAMGGSYQVDGMENSGFALYTDNLIDILMDEKKQ